MKDIKIKGEIIKMDFEQCYCQFAPLRARLVKEFEYLPHCELDDVKQLVDMNFYKAYINYNIERAEFITFAINYINWALKRLNRSHHAQKRQSYDIEVNSLNIFNDKCDSPTEFIEAITDNTDITENIILKLCLKNALNNLDETCVTANKLLMKKLKQQEVADILGVSQVQVSRFKHKFLAALKRELSA